MINKIKGLSRTKQSWLVRVYYKCFSLHQNFSDKQYGGRQMALTRAVQWRDAAKLILLDKCDEMFADLEKIKIKNIRSNTGVAGVSLTHKNNMPCYCVSFQVTNGKQSARSFSVAKYGKEEAFRLACEIRTQAMEGK